MKITDQAVDRVADLARLRFSPDERAGLAVQLNRILQYFESLAEVDTAGVEPPAKGLQPAGTLRPDEERACMFRDEVFCNAPECENNFFKVPKSIEG